MTENISSLIVAATSLCGGIVVAILAGVTIWTFRDIRSRTRDPLVQILATVMVGVVPIAGILVYFMLRPRETLSEQYVRALEEESLLASIENQEFCPTCGRRVEGEMQFCPACHTKLRNACSKCGRAVHLSWDLCPYCGSGLTPELPVTKVTKPQPKRVGAPATQQVSSSSSPTSSTTTPVVQPQIVKPSMMDRVSGAIGGMMDKVSSLTTQPQPNGQEVEENEMEGPPVVPSPSAGANSINGVSPQSKPKPVKKTPLSREELE